MQGLERKKELILERELAFANAIGAAVFEKPRVSYWMVLLPILFLYFIFRMQKYKSGRMKFDKDFMISRRRALDVAAESIARGAPPDVGRIARESGLPDALKNPYTEWMRTLVEHYMDLLAASGESFEAMARSAYGSRGNLLLSLNRLSTVEKEFYRALQPGLAATAEAAAVIATIEEQSQRLRREIAESVFG